MHTKGKWKLFKGEHSEVVEVLDNLGVPIVGWMGFDDSRRSDEEHQANARLIAAAPELLQRLEDARGAIATLDNDALGWATGDTDIGVEAWPLKEELLHRIDKAILNAKGE